MKTDVLEQFGLSHAEARIYLALLENGLSKSGSVIRLAKMQSSTVYHVLESLVDKGIVSYIYVGKVKHFRAEKPESLLFFLEERARKFREALPALRKIEQKQQMAKSAKVYQGMKGLKTAFNEMLSLMEKGEEYYFFQVEKSKLKMRRFFLFFRNYHSRRSAKGVKVRGLALFEAKETMKRIFKGLMHTTKLRYVDEFLPTGIVVARDRILNLDFEGEPAVFMIQSQPIADSYRRFFEEKWKKAKK